MAYGTFRKPLLIFSEGKKNLNIILTKYTILK